MNPNFRNFALWVIIFLLVVALVMLFQNPGQRAQTTEITFSQLLSDVDQGRVREVTLSGHDVNGHYTDGRAFYTYSPTAPGLIDKLYQKNVSITARTYIFCASHLVDSPDFASVHKDVIIEDHAWIGAGATIMPGVTIGEGAVLGAVAAATKDVPAYSIWAGVPAKEIGTRSRNLTYTLKYRAYFN